MIASRNRFLILAVHLAVAACWLGVIVPAQANEPTPANAKWAVERKAELMKLPVPRKLRGKWGERGDCSSLSKRLTITAHAFKFGNGEPQLVFFARHDGPQGQDAIHWIEEGVTSNFAYYPDDDEFVANDMGWGYPSTSFYTRCKK
jgi:hypothetical protein